MNQQERAEALGITPRQLRKDEKRGCPKDLKGARAWRTANVQQPKEPGDLTEEMTRLRAAQADLAELATAQKRGELAPIEEYQIAVNEAMVIVAGQLDGLPGRVAAQLAGMTDAAEIRQLLLDETRRIRASAAARLEDWARVAAGGLTPEAAAEANRGRVGRPSKGAAAG